VAYAHSRGGSFGEAIEAVVAIPLHWLKIGVGHAALV